MSKQPQQKVIRKLVENARPVKVKVVRGSRGIRYEVTVSGRDVEDAMSSGRKPEEGCKTCCFQ
jgi:predicted RNA-binding protein YlqC (UPF0109 family)